MLPACLAVGGEGWELRAQEPAARSCSKKGQILTQACDTLTVREPEQRVKQVALFMGSGIGCLLHSCASPSAGTEASWTPLIAQPRLLPLCGGLSSAATLAGICFMALKRWKI